jgi:xanthine dehydrogenase YagS FAD-binding subunit
LDWPVASAAAVLTVEEKKVKAASILLGQIAPAPWSAKDAAAVLVGKAVTEATAAETAAAAASGAKSLTSDPYRLTVVKAAVQRAVLAAAAAPG